MSVYDELETKLKNLMEKSIELLDAVDCESPWRTWSVRKLKAWTKLQFLIQQLDGKGRKNER